MICVCVHVPTVGNTGMNKFSGGVDRTFPHLGSNNY